MRSLPNLAGALARALARALAGASVLSGSVLWLPAPSWAEDVRCADLDPAVVRQTDTVSRPYVELEVEQAQTGVDTRGVTVAVIDAGVASSPWLPEVVAVRVGGTPGAGGARDLPTLVAGLVAGRSGTGRPQPLGLAPGARIVSVQVHDGELDGSPLTPDRVAAGIEAAVDAGADVIDVSTSTQGSAALDASVRRALGAGVVVVAAVGERPVEGQPGFAEYGAPEAGEDVLSYPAAYPGVLGVGTGSADGPVDLGTAVASSAIDVVAPVTGAVSATANGSTCVIEGGTTALAAGEVAGLAALLVARYADYAPAQIAAVIMETASGTTDDRSAIDGFGTIAPTEAMTRQLRIRPDGTVVQAEQQVVDAAPVRPPGAGDDPFAAMRGSLLWWGVLGGGGLLLALLLRPLLRR